MFGLDDWIARLSDGRLRRWSSLLVARPARPAPRDRPRPPRRRDDARRVRPRARRPHARPRSGLRGALGHALTLFVFGLPDPPLRGVPARARCSRAPRRRSRVVIVFLAVRLLVRWRQRLLPPARARRHARTHEHEPPPPRSRDAARRVRRSGSSTGMGGSAGVGVLLARRDPVDRRSRSPSLVLLAVFTAVVDDGLLTSGFGLDARRPGRAAVVRSACGAGASAFASLAFGVWYAAAAVEPDCRTRSRPSRDSAERRSAAGRTTIGCP